MQFINILAPILAIATATSAAAVDVTPRSVAPRAISDVEASAEAAMKELEAQACNAFACITAYAPTIGVCAIALIEPTPVGEIACFAAILNQAGNPPASCNGCL